MIYQVVISLPPVVCAGPDEEIGVSAPVKWSKKIFMWTVCIQTGKICFHCDGTEQEFQGSKSVLSGTLPLQNPLIINSDLQFPNVLCYIWSTFERIMLQ